MRFFRDTIIVTLLAAIGGSVVAAELQSIPAQPVIRRLPPVDAPSSRVAPELEPVIEQPAEPLLIAPIPELSLIHI